MLPWIIPPSWRYDILLYPKFVLVGVIYVGMLHHRYTGALYGLAFGMLQDIVFYGHMLGLNSFTYAIAAYTAGLLLRPSALNLFSVFIVQMCGLFLYELSSYALYRLFSVTDVEFRWSFLHGMLPSLLLSFFFALAIYIPARMFLEPAKVRNSGEE